MTSTIKNSPQKPPVKRKANLLARLLVLFLGAILALLIVAPIAIKMGIEQLLSEQAQSEVTVAEVNLNIFSGKLSLRQLNIPHRSKPHQMTLLEYASVHLDMRALFNRQLIIKELILSHAKISIERSRNQLQVAGIPLPLPSEAAPEPATAKSSTNRAPDIIIESITLESILLNYRSDEYSDHITLNSTVKNISTANSDEAVQLALTIGISGGALSYRGELLPFADEPAFNGELIVTDVDLAAFALVVPQNIVTINHLFLSHRSHIHVILPKEGAPRINLNGNTTLRHIDIISTLHNETFLKLNSIEINRIDLQYPTRVAVDEVIINDLNSALFRDNSGNLLVKQSATTPTEEKRGADVEHSTQPSKPAPLAFSIGNLSIRGDSAFTFKDATVSPGFNIKLQPFTLTIGRIDSTQPGADTAISLNATINESATLALNGNTSPLAATPRLTLNSQLTNLSLPALSPYTEANIGYQLRRGRLTAETELTIIGKQLQVNNRLSLAKLSIKESDHEKAQGLIDQLEMPLDSALDLLRDGDDNIVFDLPVNGSLDDPQFKLSGIMKLAIGKGMKMAAMNYLTTALQPLGTILLAKDIVGFVAKPRFKALSFEAGKAEINATNRAYLEKIGALLKKRPKLSITLCGVATGDDRTALAETADEIEPRLHQLAQTRADNARGFLTTQVGINGEKLFECNPSVNDKKNDTPTVVEGVEIML